MTVPNKPIVGELIWGTKLNNALEYLDTRITTVSNESADLVVPTAILDSEGDDLLVFERGGTGVVRIHAVQDDLALRSARDIILYPGDDGPGNVYINWGDADIAPDATNRVATIADIQSGTTGDITFDGVQIIGAGDASGDGLGAGTIELVPDATLETDQYLVIDPTGPNHIHIRAGGEQDDSTADLILGAEKTNVKVSDNNGAVRISTTYSNNIIQLSNESEETSSTFTTSSNPELHYVIGEGWTVKNANGDVTVEITGANSPEPGEVTFTVDEENFFVPNDSYMFTPPDDFDGDIQWEFAPNGAIYGPAMGGVRVPAITNTQAGEELGVYANRASLILSADKNVNIYSDNGDIVLNAASGGEYIGNNYPGNQIAIIEDLGEDQSFTVVGGTLGTAPTFTGAPLFTGSYVKTGPMVHFRIDVDMDNITSFGTGQYYLDLPFPAKYNYLFRNACLHDVSMPRQYGLSGHVEAGQSRMLLFYTDTSGQDYAFDYNSPALLTVNDNFHISGDYILGEEL